MHVKEKTWAEEGWKTRNAMAAEESDHANQERTAEQDVAVVRGIGERVDRATANRES